MRPITPQQNTKMRLRMRLLAAVLAVGCLGGLTVRLFVLMLRCLLYTSDAADD